MLVSHSTCTNRVVTETSANCAKILMQIRARFSYMRPLQSPPLDACVDLILDSTYFCSLNRKIVSEPKTYLLTYLQIVALPGTKISPFSFV